VSNGKMEADAARRRGLSGEYPITATYLFAESKSSNMNSATFEASRPRQVMKRPFARLS
jgi:hypothetical protein